MLFKLLAVTCLLLNVAYAAPPGSGSKNGDIYKYGLPSDIFQYGLPYGDSQAAKKKSQGSGPRFRAPSGGGYNKRIGLPDSSGSVPKQPSMRASGNIEKNSRTLTTEGTVGGRVNRRVGGVRDEYPPWM